MNSMLWAKKPKPDSAAPTVGEHCRHVAATADTIWDIVAVDLTHLCGIAPDHMETLRPLLRVAALLHDFGKVNSTFQTMLVAKPGSEFRQPVRHEILAAWLLSDECLGRWFANLRPAAEIWPIIWAIAGHHLKMADPARPPADPRQRSAQLFSLAGAPANLIIPLTACLDLFQEAARLLNSSVGLCEIDDLSYDVVADDEDSLQDCINRFANVSARVWNKLRRTSMVPERTAFLKALLIASDVAASAIVSDGRQPISWAATALRVRMTPTDLQKVIDADLGGKAPRHFQRQVEDSRRLATVVIAGCGNGKTTAAYMWGKHHAAGRKLWFTYPTTGTASAGFEDYLFAHKEIAADLFHSRSEADLVAMQGNGDDRQEESEEQFRLESLRAWDRQAIVCTVDTVLGLMQSQRRPLFSFPALAAGAFVFDEIHSYDARMFGLLLRFLKTFPGAPVLLMSASIPPQRLEVLKKVLGERASDVIHGDATLEGHKRYRLVPRDSAEACQEEVRAALSENKKVLWVCNTVADAVNTVRAAKIWASIPRENILVFHSRFRYRDRVKRQQQVVAEFAYHTEKGKQHLRVNKRGCLVVTTQVCEMSLDLSADLMVTAECPLPSFVQRLGRLNRYAHSDDPWPCLVFPFAGDPYNEQPEHVQTHGDHRIEMVAMREAVKQLADQPRSQRNLAERLNGMFGAEKYEEYSAWLDDGWISEPAPVRVGDNSITLIREEDLPLIEQELGKEHDQRSRWTSRRLVPWTIPMNDSRRLRTTRPPAGGYAVATLGTISYSEEEGAAWQTNTN